MLLLEIDSNGMFSTISALTSERSKKLFRDLIERATARLDYDHEREINYGSCEAHLFSPDFKAVIIYHVSIVGSPYDCSDRYTITLRINDIVIRTFTLDELPDIAATAWLKDKTYWFDTENGILYRDTEPVVCLIYDKMEGDPDDTEEAWINIDKVIRGELGFLPDYQIN